MRNDAIVALLPAAVFDEKEEADVGCSAAAVFSPAGGILPVQRIPVFPRKNIDSVFTVDCLDLR